MCLDLLTYTIWNSFGSIFNLTFSHMTPGHVLEVHLIRFERKTSTNNYLGNCILFVDDKMDDTPVIGGRKLRRFPYQYKIFKRKTRYSLHCALKFSRIQNSNRFLTVHSTQLHPVRSLVDIHSSTQQQPAVSSRDGAAQSTQLTRSTQQRWAVQK